MAWYGEGMPQELVDRCYEILLRLERFQAAEEMARAHPLPSEAAIEHMRTFWPGSKPDRFCAVVAAERLAREMALARPTSAGLVEERLEAGL